MDPKIPVNVHAHCTCAYYPYVCVHVPIIRARSIPLSEDLFLWSARILRHLSCLLKLQALIFGLHMLQAMGYLNDRQCCFHSEDTTVRKLMRPIIDVLL